jgi:hypothetical protein
VAAPIAVRNLNEVLGDWRPTARTGGLAAALTTAFALLVAADAALGQFYVRIGPHRTPGFGVNPGVVPIEAAEWILRTRAPAPLAHWMGDGGYLIWRLWPEYRVMSDGRTLEAFSPGMEPTLLLDDPESFVRLDARYHFGTVLLNHRRTRFALMPAWLHTSPAWRLAYLDDVSVAFVRVEAEGARGAVLDLDAPGLFPPLDDERDPAAHERYRARTRLLVQLGRADLAVREWERFLARFPDEPDGRKMLAALRARRDAGRTPTPSQSPPALEPER